MYVAECRVPGCERLRQIQQRGCDPAGVGTREPNDSQSTEAGRSGDGDDRVVCGEHNRARPAFGLAALSRNQNGLEKRIANALGRDGVVFGDRQVNDAARVRIEGTDFLGRP